MALHSALARTNTLPPPFWTRSVVSTLNCPKWCRHTHVARCDVGPRVGVFEADHLFSHQNLDRLALSSLQPQCLSSLSVKCAPIADCESPVVRYPIVLRAPYWLQSPYTSRNLDTAQDTRPDPHRGDDDANACLILRGFLQCRSLLVRVVGSAVGLTHHNVAYLPA